MSDNPNKEVMEKLERLQFLIQETFKWEDYVKTGCALEYNDKIKSVMMSADDLKDVPTVFKKFPVFPIDETERIEAGNSYNSKKKILTFIAALAVVCLVLFFLTHWNFLNSVASVCLIATLLVFFPFSQSKKTYKEKEALYNDSVKKSEDSFVAYKKALGMYEQQKVAGIEAAKTFAEQYKTSYRKYEELLDEFEHSKNTAIVKVLECIDEAKTIDFVPVEYYDLIPPILSMLKSGRADNYKEALNMAIEEQRLKEAEAARRAEEAQKIQLMQEQAAAEQRRLAEAERYNREMQQQQQLQAKMMLEEQHHQTKKLAEEQRKQAWEQKIAADKMASDARRQAERTKQAGIAKCASCANSRHCPSHIKNNGSGLTCGGYRPYGS